MKTLILTIGVGEGHNAVAKTIKNKLDSKNVGESKIVEAHQINETFRTKFYKKFYLSARKLLPSLTVKVSKKIGRKTDKDKKNFINYLNKKNMQPLLAEIKNFNPDNIVCTHPFPAIMLIHFIKQGLINAPKQVHINTFLIITDFICFPYTQLAYKVDYIITPTEDLTKKMLEVGYKKEQILPLGIPVSEDFSRQIQKEEVKRKVGLHKNRFTILISNGGLGDNKSVKLIKKLYKLGKDFQVINVNGKNQKAFNKVEQLIQKYDIHNVLNLGFVSNMPELMSASDLFIGKVGGITTNEALNKELPVITASKKLWPETENAKFLEDKNALFSVNKKRQIKKVVNSILQDPEILGIVRLNIKNVNKPNSSEDITNFIIQNFYKKTKMVA